MADHVDDDIHVELEDRAYNWHVNLHDDDHRVHVDEHSIDYHVWHDYNDDHIDEHVDNRHVARRDHVVNDDINHHITA